MQTQDTYDSAPSDENISLKQDWDRIPKLDYRLDIPEEDDRMSHNHVLRKRESRLLEGFFLNRAEGALLLSGKRGVGKTSAVIAAINHIAQLQAEQKSDKRILPVLVNAPDFEVSKQKSKGDQRSDAKDFFLSPQAEKLDQIDNVDFKRVVLQNIVRKLYIAAYEKGIADFMDVTDLFNRAVAKEVREERNFQDLQRQQDRIERQTVINLRITQRLIGVAAGFIGSIILSLNPIIPNSTLNLILSILIGVLPASALAISWNVQKTATVENESKSSAYYLYDYDVSTLQAELERTLRTLSDKEYRETLRKLGRIPYLQSWMRVKTLKERMITYLSGREPFYPERSRTTKQKTWIFEILNFLNLIPKDLLERYQWKEGYPWDIEYKVLIIIDELDKLNQDDVIKVIASLKTLFNQSSALFTLITDQTFYNRVMGDDGKRGKEYTIFSQKMFLSRPSYKEMEEFIDKIVAKSYTAERLDRNIDYQRFRNYACYASKLYFFDLYNVLRDRMSYPDAIPTLSVRLSDQEIVQANLQKALGQIYYRKIRDRQSSDWYKNDSTLDKIYELLSISEERIGSEFAIEDDPGLEYIFHETPLHDKKTLLMQNSEEKAVLGELVSYLTTLEFYISPSRNVYRITGRIRQVPKFLIMHTQEENEFVIEFEKFLSLLLTYFDLMKRFQVIPGEDINGR